MRLIVLLIVLAAALGVFGQTKSISRQDYYKAYRAASDNFERSPVRRETRREQFFSDGKQTGSVEAITENIAPDRWRLVETRVTGKDTNKKEYIRVGATIYCRTNDGGWNASSNCGGGGSGITNVVRAEYSVEKVKENGINALFYRQRTLYKNEDAAGKEVLWYWELRFWLDEDGRFLREEAEHGIVETKEIRSKSVTTREYNPKGLKIESPI